MTIEVETSFSSPGGNDSGFVAPPADACPPVRHEMLFESAAVLRAQRELEKTVAELHVANTARSRTESLLLSVVRDAPCPMYGVARDGKLLFWNAACEALFGYTSEESLGKRPQHLTTKEANQSFDSNLKRVFCGETVFGKAGTRAHRDGQIVEIEVSASPLWNEDGTIVAAVVINTDVSARNQAFEALRASEAARCESESRYRGIVEDQTELVCRYLPDTTLTFVNAAFAAFYGRRTRELLGTRLLDIFPESDRAGEMRRLASFGPDHVVEIQEDWEPRHDGVIRWYHWTDRAFLDDAGEVVEFQSVGHDMHEHRTAQHSMARHAEILEMVAKGNPLTETLSRIAMIVESESSAWRCSLMMVNADGKLVTEIAPSLPIDFAATVGPVPIAVNAGTCGAAAALGTAVHTADVRVDPAWAEFQNVAVRYNIRSAWSTPMFNSYSGDVIGTLAVYSTEAGLPREDHVRFVESLVRLAEIAIERKGFEDQLAHEAVTDPLTGIPNRTLLMDRLQIALARALRARSEVAVLFLDLDGFKLVNDSLGHEAGDELLKALARRLEGVVRPGDTVARFGGDEFIVLCEDLPRSFACTMAAEIAERMFDVLEQPFQLQSSEVFLRASIGIAAGGRKNDNANDLLRDADAAMYRAKDLGKGRWVVFDEAMRQSVVAQHETFNALHRSLERGELVVYYQPIVTLDDGACRGAEALVRWNHPERGLLAPDAFIALAEQSDLIVRIDEFVLETAAIFARDSGVDDFVVSVNLSARSLASFDVVERIAAVLCRTVVDPRRICLEITESAVIGDAAGAARKIDGLKNLGVGLAIDDFGTGYSSLAYLKRFRVDTVKIDRSFVSGLGHDDGDRAIVAAVVSMAGALGLSVLAEGIETVAQLDELKALGCSRGQGYLYSRPIPVNCAADLIYAVADDRERDRHSA